jgi:ribosomal protein S18 acetylase RimI-like enzyme
MNIRPATPADTPFLKELHRRAYLDVIVRQFGYWDDDAQDYWFRKGLAEAAFSVVEENGEAVGAIAVHDLPERLYLAELQILPERQARGLGTALLRMQLERAQHLQKPIGLRVLHASRARALYERHGFVVTERTQTHYLMEWKPDGADA